ncbi:MAG TPA: amidase family protein, partial [Gemmatimonadaceae bacterium]|nr:amidase family protein [Gemmatimonadaceae bacterium]
MPDQSLSRRDFGKRLGAAAIAARLTSLPDVAPLVPPTAASSPHMPDEPLNAARTAGDELCAMTAIELAGRIRRKDVSAREVMEAHLARIGRVNPKVNAIVTLVPEQAMAWAKEADERQARGETLGVLHGLPVAHKDLVDTAGIRTTRGSLLFKDNIPTTDALIVRRVRAAGAITLGKTNTPEFGAGSNTF